MLPCGGLKGLACSPLNPSSFPFKDFYIVMTLLPVEISMTLGPSIQRFSETLKLSDSK